MRFIDGRKHRTPWKAASPRLRLLSPCCGGGEVPLALRFAWNGDTAQCEKCRRLYHVERKANPSGGVLVRCVEL